MWSPTAAIGSTRSPTGTAARLYLEVVPLSFAVQVEEGLSLNQLRLIMGRSPLTDAELLAEHRDSPLLFRNGQPVPLSDLALADGLFLSLDLRGDKRGHVGFRAKLNTPGLDMSAIGSHRVDDYWERVTSEERARIVLDPERFYLLLSEESVRVPPTLAAEMTAFDPTSGELRTHYAGFFDPGFGYSRDGQLLGSRAALEVRAHDVPFMIEQGQGVCKLTFERMLGEPDELYGDDVGSNYQGQMQTLSKHFRVDRPALPQGRRRRPASAARRLRWWFGERIAVVGAGVKTPVGNDLDTIWSCSGPVTRVQRHGTTPVASRCRRPCLHRHGFRRAGVVSAPEERRLDRAHHLAIGAAQDRWTRSARTCRRPSVTPSSAASGSAPRDLRGATRTLAHAGLRGLSPW